MASTSVTFELPDLKLPGDAMPGRIGRVWALGWGTMGVPRLTRHLSLPARLGAPGTRGTMLPMILFAGGVVYLNHMHEREGRIRPGAGKRYAGCGTSSMRRYRASPPGSRCWRASPASER